MKEIILKNGEKAMVDDSDFEYLNQFKWRCHKKKRISYATRQIYLGKKKNPRTSIWSSIWEEVPMHREILGLKKGDKRQGDHRDHNGLNNQRNNLRIVTKDENSRNRNKTLSKVSSKFKGVSLIDNFRKNKWRALLNINNETIHIGCFPTEELAAKAYNEVAKKHHGEFAYLNVV